MGTVQELTDAKCKVIGKNGHGNFNVSLSTGTCTYLRRMHKVAWIGNEEFEGLSFKAMVDLVEQKLAQAKQKE